MTDDHKGSSRRPGAFTLNDTSETPARVAEARRAPRSFDSDVAMVPEANDPFLAPEEIDAVPLPGSAAPA